MLVLILTSSSLLLRGRIVYLLVGSGVPIRICHRRGNRCRSVLFVIVLCAVIVVVVGRLHVVTFESGMRQRSTGLFFGADLSRAQWLEWLGEWRFAAEVGDSDDRLIFFVRFVLWPLCASLSPLR